MKIDDLNGATMYRSGTFNSDGVFVPDAGQVIVSVDIDGNPVAPAGGGGGGSGGTVKIDPTQNTVKVDGTVPVSGPITNAQAVAIARGKAATNLSGSITAGGTSQALAASNTSRNYLTIQNISTGDLWVSEFGAASAASGSYKLQPNESGIIRSSNAVTIFGATTGQAFTASEVNV